MESVLTFHVDNFCKFYVLYACMGDACALETRRRFVSERGKGKKKKRSRNLNPGLTAWIIRSIFSKSYQKLRIYLLSLVLICRRHTWDTVTAYVIIYRRIIIYPRHWPPACLRSWAEFNFVGKPAVVGGCRRWKYFMWTSSADATYSSKTIGSIFTGKIFGNCAIRFAFRVHLSMSAMHCRWAGDPLGQIAERCQLQPATTSQVGRWDMRTRL